MKVLLIKPIQLLNGVYELTNYIPDIGLGYLATALRRAGHQVDIVDFSRDHAATFEDYRRQMAMADCDCVVFKVYSMNIPSMRKNLAILRALKPDIPIVVGGPHPSAVGQEIFFELSQIDFSFVGEAELGLPMLVGHLQNPPTQSLQEIPGLLWRRGQEIVVNRQHFNADLDALGVPAWDLLLQQALPHMQDTFGGIPYYIPILTSRGCPYRCSYCGGHFVMGSKIRTHSAGHVVDQMELLLKQHGIGAFSVVDDNFTGKKGHAAAICQEIISRDLDISWDLVTNGIHMTSLDAELVQLLQRAGCFMVAIAIESGTERILKDMRKPIRLKKVPQTIQLIRDHSQMLICSYFILGYPGETKTDVLRTVELACSLDLDYAKFHIFTPQPHTEITARLQRDGQLPAHDYESYTHHEPVIEVPGLTPEELKTLHSEAIYRFYLRPLGKNFGRHSAMRATRLRYQRDAKSYFSALRMAGRKPIVEM